MKKLFKLFTILIFGYVINLSCATIQGNLDVKGKLEVSKTGKFIDGVQSDTWISIIKSNAKIRYNNGINKWQFTNDGITWYDFVTEGGGSFTETDPIFTSWDKSTGILIHYSQITDFDTGINTNQNVIKGSTAYSWGNHAGLYDISGTANSLLSNHLSTYDHSKLHDLTTILDSHTIDFSINGQEITGSVKTSDSITYETNIGLKLVNDSNSPGASKYYGTDSSNVKGFFSLPEPGEINTASNVGNGTGIFYQKLNNDLQFKSLVAGDNVTFDTTVSTEIKINVSSSGGGGGISGSGTTGTIAKWNTSSSLTDSSISETTPAGRTTGNAFNSDTYIESGLFIKVMSSKPSAPPAGRIAIYYRNGAMYYQDSAGTETEMCRATDETIYETDIVFNFNGEDLQDYTTSETGFGRILKAETSGFGQDSDGGGSLDTADKKYGTASLYFGGMGKGMLLENTKGFELLTDNWTFEFWIKFNPDFLLLGPQTFLYCGTGNFGANDFYRIYYEPGEPAGYLYFIAYKNGSCIASYYSETVYSTMEDGGWHHLAFVRNGNNMLMFVDGDKKTVTANTSFSSSISNIPGFIILGADGNGAISMYGWMDDFRFRRSAVYTDDFTPPEEF